MAWITLVVLAGLLALADPALAAVTFGQLDDFQNGSTMGWAEGVPSPNPPTHAASGGPRGTGDGYLENVSSGGFSAGGKMVMFNNDQWAGDYAAAGVTRIDASLANFGPEPLFMRVALLTGSSVYGSTAAVELPADGLWRRVTFDLTSAGLTKVEGSETLAQALTHVSSLRLLSVRDAPSNLGDGVVATLGTDDVRALRLPGDANFDGRVNAADLLIARRNLGAPGTHSWREGDFDFDGRVTARDVVLLRRHFGNSVAAPAGAVGAAALGVPEPNSLALLLVLAPALLRRRRA